MNDVIFVDTETTGLDPDRHEVWDIALIEADGTEHEWHVRPQNLHNADEGALRITHFYERVKAAGFTEEVTEEGYPRRPTTVRRANFWTPENRNMMAGTIASLTANKHLVGAVPWFDARFLTGFLGREGYVPAWHYHMIDVETLAVGALNGRWPVNEGDSGPIELPWDTGDLAKALGINTESALFAKHTAIGDARFARAIYRAVIEGRWTE